MYPWKKSIPKYVCAEEYVEGDQAEAVEHDEDDGVLNECGFWDGSHGFGVLRGRS